MAGRRAAPRVVLSESERSELKGLAGRRKTAQAMAVRAPIVLTCAERVQSKQVAARLGVDEMRVRSESGADASPGAPRTVASGTMPGSMRLRACCRNVGERLPRAPEFYEQARAWVDWVPDLSRESESRLGTLRATSTDVIPARREDLKALAYAS